jgi:hypothetical protein
MLKIDVPHPLGNREFTTRTDAAKFARAFGLNPRAIVAVTPAPSVIRPRPVRETEQ